MAASPLRARHRQTAPPSQSPLLQPPPHPRTPLRPLPRHRSPYGLPTTLDGTASALVRPYLAALEQEAALQQHRRLALVLAADFGIDLDRHLIGAQEVAA